MKEKVDCVIVERKRGEKKTDKDTKRARARSIHR